MTQSFTEVAFAVGGGSASIFAIGWQVLRYVRGLIDQASERTRLELENRIEQDRAEREQIKKLIDLFSDTSTRHADGLNKLRDSYDVSIDIQRQTHTAIVELNTSMTANTTAITALFTSQQERDNKLNNTLERLTNTIEKLPASIEQNTASVIRISSAIDTNTNTISDMEATFRAEFDRMGNNITKKLDHVAHKIGELSSASKAGNKQHDDIIREIGEVKKAVLSLLPPPPKPPKEKVYRLPQSADNEDDENEEKSA